MQINDIEKFVKACAVEVQTEFPGSVTMLGLKTATAMFTGEKLIAMSGIELPENAAPPSWWRNPYDG